MYTQLAANDFPGLDLVSSPDEAGCIDMSNIEFDIRGAIRARDGTANFTSSAAATQYYGLAPLYRTDLSTTHLVAVRGSTIEALTTAGASAATQSTGSTYTQPSFARFGSPGNEFLYVAVCTAAGGAPTSFWRWNGSTFTTISPASSKPAVVGLHPTDNRLAFANFNSGYSRVNFSDEGTPETFGANNYVEVTPGDGEPIRAMVTWGDSLFVFKETKFFVFYGTTVSADAVPEFNYRTIATGQGAVGSRAVAVAPEGVYFCSRDGIYLTTGGQPERISNVIEPIFTNELSPFATGIEPLDHSQVSSVAMTYFKGRLYFAYPVSGTTGNQYLLVYDTKQEKWMSWGLWAAALSTFRIGSEAELVYAENGVKHIVRFSNAYTQDKSIAFTAWYRTGFTDFGSSLEKRIVKTRLFGIASNLEVKWSRDFGDLGDSKSVTLGTSPAIDQGVVDCNVPKGRLWSWQIEGVGGSWTVYRLQHEVDPLGQPDTVTA